MKGMFESVLMGSKVCNDLFPRVLRFEIILVEVGGCISTNSAGGTVRLDRLGALGARKQRDLA